jgi:hypothetical protein
MTLYGWQYNRATSRSYRSLVVATEPTTDARPVTVAEAKEHLRIVDFTDDDDYIAGLIDAARKWCEDYCERTFADCQYTVAFDDFQAVRIELPRPPLRLNASSSEATVSIAYVDTGGTTQTLTWAESSTQDFRGSPTRSTLRLGPAHASTTKRFKSRISRAMAAWQQCRRPRSTRSRCWFRTGIPIARRSTAAETKTFRLVCMTCSLLLHGGNTHERGRQHFCCSRLQRHSKR